MSNKPHQMFFFSSCQNKRWSKSSSPEKLLWTRAVENDSKQPYVHLLPSHPWKSWRNKSCLLPKYMMGVFLAEKEEDNDFNLLHKEKKKPHAHVCTQKCSLDRVCQPWDLGVPCLHSEQAALYISRNLSRVLRCQSTCLQCQTRRCLKKTSVKEWPMLPSCSGWAWCTNSL